MSTLLPYLPTLFAGLMVLIAYIVGYRDGKWNGKFQAHLERVQERLESIPQVSEQKGNEV